MSELNPVDHAREIVFAFHDAEIISTDFDLLFKRVKELAIAATNPQRAKRSTFDDEFPFAQPATCSLTEKELNRILNLLQSVGNKEASSFCKQSTKRESQKIETSVVSQGNSEEQCGHIIESIIQSLKDLKEAFCSLTNTSLTDVRYEEQKATYEALIRQLKRQLDDTELGTTQKYKTILDKMERDFQKLEKNMRDTLDQLEKERSAHRETKMKLVLSELKNGKYQSALDTFQSLETRNNTIKLLMDAVQKESVSPEHVINFVGGLRFVDTMVQSTIQLFNELERSQKGLRDGKTATLFYDTVEKIIKHLVKLEENNDFAIFQNIDDDIIDQLIVIHNKLYFLRSLK